MKTFKIAAIMAMMWLVGCNGVRLDSEYQARLAQAVDITCNCQGVPADILADDARYWNDVLAESQRFFGGVGLSATYRDLVNRRAGWAAQAAHRVTTTPTLTDQIMEIECDHLRTFQKASQGLK